MKSLFDLTRLMIGEPKMMVETPTGMTHEPNQPSQQAKLSGKDYWHSGELLGDRIMTRIEHDGYVYILRVTRENRLILTK